MAITRKELNVAEKQGLSMMYYQIVSSLPQGQELSPEAQAKLVEIMTKMTWIPARISRLCPAQYIWEKISKRLGLLDFIPPFSHELAHVLGLSVASMMDHWNGVVGPLAILRVVYGNATISQFRLLTDPGYVNMLCRWTKWLEEKGFSLTSN